MALNNTETKFDIANEHEACDELSSICWGTLCFRAILHDCGANVVSKIINCTGGCGTLEGARSQNRACFQHTERHSVILQILLMYWSQITINLDTLKYDRGNCVIHMCVTSEAEQKTFTHFVSRNNCYSSLHTWHVLLLVTFSSEGRVAARTAGNSSVLHGAQKQLVDQ